jgi:hypothetical protein
MKVKMNEKIAETMWWPKGQTLVHVVKRGNFPTSVFATLPDGTETQIDIIELEDTHGIDPRK